MKKICPKCGIEVSAQNYSRHLNRCDGNGFGYYIKQDEPDSLDCPYCGKTCKNLNSFRQHSVRCKNNSNRKSYNNFSKYIEINRKGKTADNCPEIAKQVATMKKKYAEGFVNPTKGRKIIVEYLDKITSFYPEEICAMIIQELINLSREYIGREINEAIITVPSYYNDSQRQAIIDSGKICGLNKLKIVNEDIAVCYAYNLVHYEKENILVFNMRSNEINITILHLNNSNFEIKVTESISKGSISVIPSFLKSFSIFICLNLLIKLISLPILYNSKRK